MQERLEKESEQDEANVSPKTLDEWEDEHLLYFLENNKHISGSSVKQVKRINKCSSNYRLTKLNGEQKLWYKRTNQTNWVEIPKLVKREEIVTKSHLLGHFGFESKGETILES